MATMYQPPQQMNMYYEPSAPPPMNPEYVEKKEYQPPVQQVQQQATIQEFNYAQLPLKKITCIAGICFLVLIVIAVIATGIALAVVFIPRNAERTIVIQSANTKQLWMTRMAELFNQARMPLKSNAIAKVSVAHTGSTLNISLNPKIYSPANDEWINEATVQPYLTEQSKRKCVSTTNIPLGIAMWRSMAVALGWPTQRISLRDIVTLAAQNNGWAQRGYPQWGTFKFGHGHPRFSNSGRLTVTAALYAFNNLPSNVALTSDVVNSINSANLLKNFSLSVNQMGQIDTALLDKMVERGQQYLHAVANYESNVIRYNSEFKDRLADQLVLIYPSDGTYFMNHPMCILDVNINSEEREVAEMFLNFINTESAKREMINTGVRPFDSTVSLTFTGSPFTLENGVVITNNAETIRVLPIPPAALTSEILNVWTANKKEAYIVMVIDVSGSMSGSKIANARNAAISFVQSMVDNDFLEILTFSNSLTWLPSGGQISTVRNSAVSAISTLFASGGTALYDATAAANQRLNQRRNTDLASNIRRNYAVVLLSDGEDTSSTTFTSLSALLRSLPDGSDSAQVRIHTIAYGSDADQTTLREIATKTNGLAQVGSPSNIQSIYTQISMEF